MYKETPIQLAAYFSAKKAGREWCDVLKMIKGKKLQPRILYLARFLFSFDREIKILQTSKS